MNPKLTSDRLRRRAVIYIRQSSPGQVMHNHESQRRQYGLADRARELGFQEVTVIDEDLGRSGSGWWSVPGFSDWSPKCVVARSERYFASRRPAWPEMVAIGTT
jgi:hypothetical protein